ncbi:similar to stage IV sporulation protein [Marininema mesophilum]|uniref:Similar to stage IV sporulation protein n=1 Tax=Marininema mesophilum TaxID=1048340 RepID=A0A1H2R668_9BACL|nr:sporulation protein YqfD [Marininema mesophilum]SDW14344.1 similar to stage IV sporulation protein [Marininema mesophilum]
MQNQWPQSFKGSLHIDIRGENLADFINQATKAGLHLSKILWVDDQRICLTIPVADFYRLRPFLRSTKTRVRIRNKVGLPFWIARVKRRHFFLWGMGLFIAIIIFLSSLVWSVEVEGNEIVPTREILSSLQQEGVYVGQMKSQIPKISHLQHHLMEKIPRLSWVGFRIEGTRAILTVVEKKRITEEEQKGEHRRVNLVAKRSGMVTDIQVERGHPLVDVNDIVKKGQLIVSGRYGDKKKTPDTVKDDPIEEKFVGAEGKVLGEVWYESTVTVPLTQKRKVYTGRRVRETHPYLAGRVVRLPFITTDLEGEAEFIQRVHKINVWKWTLPFGWVKEEQLAMKWVYRKLSQKNGILIGRQQARVQMLSRLGEDGRILEEKILHASEQSGKVVMKIHFTVIENIASPQPILQGE